MKRRFPVPVVKSVSSSDNEIIMISSDNLISALLLFVKYKVLGLSFFTHILPLFPPTEVSTEDDSKIANVCPTISKLWSAEAPPFLDKI